MNPSTEPLPMRLFDREADLSVVERRLPHWSQAGTICFITWRTHDSIPKPVLDEWYDDRNRWLTAHGIDPGTPCWKAQLSRLPLPEVRAFLTHFAKRWHSELDAGRGACELRRPEIADVVVRSLHHFDGDRYLMLDFVVMPNHVHVLASFPDEEVMLAQCESWKHFTATQINRRLKRRGRFWQQDAFDHLVRTESQLEYFRKYIAENPDKAGLRNDEYARYSKKNSSRGA